MLLEGEGFDVRTASSGAQALQLVAEKHPDLVLLDIMMPAMTGFDVCGHLRADPATRNIPVVAYSAYPLRHSNIGLYDRVLLKPAEIDEIVQAIRSLLSARKGSQPPAKKK